ncbi:ABC-F family ATP-binding cassette domain-containing protein [bacterium]|nr:MAG: ABC-F family ATP-binding cassette domain-containing protein [bacterium]
MEVKISKLKKQFGKLVLFDNFNTFISNGETIGIYGENGSGKTTFLDIFAGIQTPTLGKIEYLQSSNIAYFEQNDLKNFQEILNEVVANITNYKHTELVDGINLNSNNFSSGERAKIYLTKIINLGANVYLFDEPTNHLDEKSIRILAHIIKNLYGVKILASHDETFLKLAASKIWYLKNNQIEIYKGNFEKFWYSKREKEEETEERFRLVMKKIEKYRENDRRRQDKFTENKKIGKADPVKVFRKKYKFIHQNKVYKNRVRRLLNKELPKLPKDKQDLLLEFAYAPFENNEPLMVIDNLSKSYTKRKVLNNLDFQIEPKEKILVIGPNGSGKTTLLKILAGIERDFEGKITRGEKLNLAYFKQDNFDDLNYKNTVFEEFVKFVLHQNHDTFKELETVHNITAEQVLEQIKLLEFDSSYTKRGIADLSEGEKIKLRFAKLLLLEPNLLLLDEPTNHLDSRNKTGVLNAIKNFEGAIIVVTHDPEVINLINWDYKINL